MSTKQDEHAREMVALNSRWASAQTLADHGALVDGWLLGQTPYVPAQGGVRDAPELVFALSLLNRTGLVTTASKAAMSRGRWRQRAMVSGYSHPEVIAAIREAATAAGLTVVGSEPEPVTEVLSWGTWAPVAHTRTGDTVEQDLPGYQAILDPQAREAYLAAEHITVVDPNWGRRWPLWQMLYEVTQVHRFR